MENAFGAAGELQTLQRDVAELQASRRRIQSVDSKKESESLKNHSSADITTEGVATSEQSDLSENILSQLVEQMEETLQEVEEIVMERPALALLGAFAFGAIVGHLTSRR